MTAFSPSKASRAEMELYSSGECHVLAAAFCRKAGWPILLVLDMAERWWEDPSDPDNFIPSVVHAYALDPDGYAWDIAGRRPTGDVPSDAHARFQVMEYGSDELRSEGELRAYVGCWGEEGEDIERPLWDYADDDIEAAWEAACRALGHLPGFPAEVPACAP